MLHPIKEGKIIGLRLAAENLQTWARRARGVEDEEQAVALEEAADSLAQIADRLEEEG